MFIVIEGPDGAGKSTLVHHISKQLWREGRGCVLINPKASPNRPPLDEYENDLSFYMPGGNHDLILDRCWWSEEVYGPRWRDAGLQPGVLDHLNAWALGLGAVFVLLDADDDLLVQRVIHERGDDEVGTAEEVLDLAQAYRTQDFHHIPIKLTWPYDARFVAQQVVTIARMAEADILKEYS